MKSGIVHSPFTSPHRIDPTLFLESRVQAVGDFLGNLLGSSLYRALPAHFVEG
jgi:hypothetical protein